MKIQTTRRLWPLLMAAAGCSNLSVTEIPKDPCARADGVPYYPLRQDFVVSELGLDETGKPTSAVKWKIELVARPDYERGYLIRNSPTWFAKTDFSVTRDAKGGTLSVSADVEDQTLETVSALASFVTGAAKAASLAGARDGAKGAQDVGGLQAEYDNALKEKSRLTDKIEGLKTELGKRPGDPKLLAELRVAREELKPCAQTLVRIPLLQELLVMRAARRQALQTMEQLAQAKPANGKEIKQVKDNLVALGERIAELEKQLAEKESPTGTLPSQRTVHPVMVVDGVKAAETEARKLEAPQIGVYLVPRK